MLIIKAYKILLLPYTLLLLYLMFFGFGREPMEAEVVRVSPIASTYRFIENRLLFRQYYSIITNLLGNVILFIPFGCLGWIFPQYNRLNPLLIDFLTAIIIIESLQYFTRLGVFDVDDVLLNSLGVALGFLLMKKCNGLLMRTNIEN